MEHFYLGFLRKESTQGRGEELFSAFSERVVRARDTSLARYLITISLYSRFERERERTASKTWVVVAMKSHSPLLGRLC